MLINPSIDEIFEINDFKIGATFIAKKRQIYPAGKAISFALSCKKFLSDKSLIRVLYLVGKNEQQLYDRFLNSEDIIHNFLSVNCSTRSNKTIVDPKNKTTTHIRTQDFFVSLYEINKLLEIITKDLEKEDIVVFSGSIPFGIPSDVYDKMIRQIRIKGATTVLDSSGEALKLAILSGPTIVKSNLLELSQILGDPNLINLSFKNIKEDFKFISDKVKFLLEKYHIKIGLITLAHRGAILVTSDQIIYGNLKIDNPLDTVGSGDAFLGGFISQFVQNNPLETSFKLALACGAANTLKIGPGQFDAEVAFNLQKKVELCYLD
ncbi:MAG: hypothetical protein JW891_18985 [Candidatus Lokiarchaeota archaeon]|nr:hypothetical protein [Candidatus Lokiarchaeota archaeon]